jgi:hypothetical protein
MSRVAAFVEAARISRELLERPEVAARWTEPSALVGLTVGGLAEHLAQQVLLVPGLLAAPAPDPVPPVASLLEHYARSTWFGADLDEPANVGIRDRSEQAAAEGPGQLLARVAQALAECERELPAQPAGRLVQPPRVTWSLALDDYLTTRLMEMVVHADDLAFTLGVATPLFPEDVTDPVLGLLVRLAARRHGFVPVVRALARAERAPASVTAF